MIRGFDHAVIAVRDLAAGVSAYETLLGRQAVTQPERDGVASALIVLSNVAVEFMAPATAGESARRLAAALEDGGEGLKSLVFATDDLDRLRQRADRVGLSPEAVSLGPTWRSFRAETARTHGVRLFFMQRDEPLDSLAGGETLGLDHVVIRSPDTERAAALYGARLGLDMRLERDMRNARFMFFRCGDAIVEIVEDNTLIEGRDRLWGLSWRVKDADASRARLAGAGVNVSEVRAGLKPGTRVFTVRDKSCGVPTLMIEQGVR